MRPPTAPARATLFAALSGALAALAPAALAQDAPVSPEAARAALFRTARVEVTMLPAPFVTEAEARALVEVGSEQPYYGAIAAAPDEGVQAPSVMLAANHHSVAAAAMAARAGCDARRQGGAPCVVVAEIRPRSWEARRLSLSMAASAVVRGELRRLARPRALAIAPETGAFAFRGGEGAAAAALAECRAAARGAPCVLAVADPAR